MKPIELNPGEVKQLECESGAFPDLAAYAREGAPLVITCFVKSQSGDEVHIPVVLTSEKQQISFMGSLPLPDGYATKELQVELALISSTADEPPVPTLTLRKQKPSAVAARPGKRVYLNKLVNAIAKQDKIKWTDFKEWVEEELTAIKPAKPKSEPRWFAQNQTKWLNVNVKTKLFPPPRQPGEAFEALLSEYSKTLTSSSLELTGFYDSVEAEVDKKIPLAPSGKPGEQEKRLLDVRKETQKLLPDEFPAWSKSRLDDLLKQVTDEKDITAWNTDLLAWEHFMPLYILKRLQELPEEAKGVPSADLPDGFPLTVRIEVKCEIKDDEDTKDNPLERSYHPPVSVFLLRTED